jgi:hypothetical protein
MTKNFNRANRESQPAFSPCGFFDDFRGPQEKRFVPTEIATDFCGYRALI